MLESATLSVFKARYSQRFWNSLRQSFDQHRLMSDLSGQFIFGNIYLWFYTDSRYILGYTSCQNLAISLLLLEFLFCL